VSFCSLHVVNVWKVALKLEGKDSSSCLLSMCKFWNCVDLPTGCATCMTFRHRHSRRSDLIGTAEIGRIKAEVRVRKKERMERIIVSSDPKAAHAADFFCSPCTFARSGDNIFLHLPTHKEGKRLRKPTDTGTNQALSSHKDGCRTFLDPRAEERRGAANASRWMYCR
jgi:hypothetical protein